jgi:hypothetical protein
VKGLIRHFEKNRGELPGEATDDPDKPDHQACPFRRRPTGPAQQRARIRGGTVVTILSINRKNTIKNQSLYARRRSIKKGNRNQLRDVVEVLRHENRTVKMDIHGTFTEIRLAFDSPGYQGRSFALGTNVKCVPKGLGTYYEVKFPPPEQWRNTVAEDLKSDLKLIWDDLNRICRLRESGDWQDYVFVVAISRRLVDIVFSKYGYSERSGGHFYHWQAVSKGIHGIHVDDLYVPGEHEQDEVVLQ